MIFELIPEEEFCQIIHTILPILEILHSKSLGLNLPAYVIIEGFQMVYLAESLNLARTRYSAQFMWYKTTGTELTAHRYDKTKLTQVGSKT